MTKEEQSRVFSENLSRYIKDLGYTQMEIAEALGVSQQAVHNWVSGENVPRLNKAQKLAQFLGVKLTDLVYPYDLELQQSLEEAFTDRPEMRVLFKLAKDCSPDEVKQAIKIIEALRDTNK